MKKFLSVILCFVLLVSGVVCVNAEVAFKFGDVDGDGGITSGDARLALRYSINLEKLTDEQAYAADVDGDGSVTAGDARLILRGSIGLENTNTFGRNGSEIFTSGVYSMEAVTDVESGTKFVIANTENSTYLEASFPLDNLFEDTSNQGKIIRVGFLTIDEDVFMVLPDATPIAYLRIDEKAKNNIGIDAEIFKSIIPAGIAGEIGRDADKKTEVTVGGIVYYRWIFENEDGSCIAHDMRGTELKYIRTFDADGNETSVMRVDSITGNVPNAQKSLVQGGKLYEAKEGDAEDDIGYILQFMMLLASMAGVSTDDLLNGQQ